MATNDKLAQRVRVLLQDRTGFAEKNMFGGVCFLLRGNMACGIINDDLIVRVGPDNYDESLKLPDTRKFDITGRPMKGWVMVSARSLKTKKDLAAWIEKGAEFSLTLPAK